ncbi:MAG: glycosyltransferase family 39 protein [bacterium]|nr:glycosyltransferase family 39 protein [bacterium]
MGRLLALLKKDLVISALLAAAKFFISLPFLGSFDFIVDEPQYLASASHLALGYVNDAPLLLWLLALSNKIFGISPLAIRLFPLLACSLAVFAIGYFTKILGGGPKAQALASFALLGTPEMVESSVFLMMTSYEPIYYILIFSQLAKLLNEPEDAPKQWIILGVILCIALLHKYTIILLDVCALSAILLAGRREILKTPYFAAAILIEALGAIPSLIWWPTHDWAGFRYLFVCVEHRFDVIETLIGQLLIMGSVTSALSLSGLFCLLVCKQMRKFRAIGITCLLFCAFFIINQSESRFYTAAIISMAAAGACMAEKYISRLIPYMCALSAVYFCSILLLFTNPYYDSNGALKVRLASILIPGLWGPAPGEEIDQTGSCHSMHWPERFSAISYLYRQMPADAQKECVLLTIDNDLYWSAHMDDKYSLPHAACNHHTAFYWGLPNKKINKVIGANPNVNTDKLLQQFYRTRKEFSFPIYNSDGTIYENYQVSIWSDPIEPDALRKNWPLFHDISH